MQLATWNVNSIKMRLTQVLDWLETTGTDALVMQEIKTVDELFPLDAFSEAGFDALVCGQKNYNGVALVTRRASFKSVSNPIYNIPGYEDAQKRLIAATLELKSGTKVRFAGAYFPNGQEIGCDKYLYKLDWIAALTLWLNEINTADQPPLILGGDFNIAPSDEDVWDASLWKDKILVSEPERNAYRGLLATGLVDTWSLGLHAPDTFSWWDYRQAGFEKNHGLRIDHLLASKTIENGIESVWIDAAPRALDKPSDHAPVVMKLIV